MPADDGAILFEILRGDSGLRAPAAERIDALYDTAAAHGLLGLVHEALERREIILPRWKAYAEQAELAAKVQLQAASEIAAALKAEKINAVFAKGVAWALTIYPRHVRPMNDLDLLILPQDLRATHRILCGLGYSADNSLSNPIELSYIRERLPGFRISVDLHWDFTGEDGLQAGVRMPLKDIFTRSRREREISIPSNEDALLLAAANLARKCGEPLVLIVDFARLLQRPLDWKALAERATAWGLKTPLWLGAIMAQKLMGTSTPLDWQQRLSPPGWRARKLTKMLDGDALWLPDKQQRLSYRAGFKLLCLDSWGGVCAVALGAPKGVLRKMGLSANLAARVLRENPAPVTSPDV